MTKQEYEKLLKEIHKHDAAYYSEAKPLISDFEYDQLVKRVEAIEKAHPGWADPNSPTNRVGETVTKGFKQVKHRIPMMSLANTYSEQELLDFIARMEKWTKKQELVYGAELKMDGAAVTVRYEKGKFVQALTRGDGMRGDDVTANVKTISLLPLELKGGVPDLVEFRGEVFLSHNAFRSANKKREEEGEEVWANPRNAAAGSLKLLDSKEVQKRRLSVLFYDIAEDSSRSIKTQSEAHAKLKAWGLPTFEDRHTMKTSDPKAILSFAHKIEKERGKLGFDIDGIVIKLDDIPLRQELGATGKSPRWAVAYKFAPEQATTKIEGITVQVGRTGVLTPVAELKPVSLAGSTISRATLHNEEEVARKDIRVGDTVVIEKGGDVIPKVVSVDAPKRPKSSRKWTMPENCPICDSEVVRKKGEVAVRCPNPDCGQQVLRRLTHFASKKAMDIDHMGPKVIEQLIDHGFVSTLSDIYTLTEEELAQLDGFKEKAIDNLLRSIEASKESTLPRFLFALGIPFVGEGVAGLIANAGGDLKGVMALTEEDLLNIEGVGEKVALSFLTFFQNPAHKDEALYLVKLGVKPKTLRTKKGHPFAGKTFVLTGTLDGYSRQEATALIKERGGTVSSSVSKRTDFLLLGENPGSKYDKAVEIGVAILSEKQFTNRL